MVVSCWVGESGSLPSMLVVVESSLRAKGWDESSGLSVVSMVSGRAAEP